MPARSITQYEAKIPSNCMLYSMRLKYAVNTVCYIISYRQYNWIAIPDCGSLMWIYRPGHHWLFILEVDPWSNFAQKETHVIHTAASFLFYPCSRIHRWGHLILSNLPLLTVVFSVSHTLVMIYQMISLNVAVNSYDHALLTLLVSNQFVEIKGSVFKKFEKDNLFQITCAGIWPHWRLSTCLIPKWPWTCQILSNDLRSRSCSSSSHSVIW